MSDDIKKKFKEVINPEIDVKENGKIKGKIRPNNLTVRVEQEIQDDTILFVQATAKPVDLCLNGNDAKDGVSGKFGFTKKF